MRIVVDEKTWEVAEGENYARIFAQANGSGSGRILGVACAGKTLPLTAYPEPGVSVRTLTYADEEGRRIYERSLRFVFLLAVRTLYPKARVRIENSAYGGVYATIDEAPLSVEAVARIEEKMHALVAENLPFDKRNLSRTEAIAFFEREGSLDKVRLLKYRPFEHFQLYECGGMFEYFYGEMAPSTGYLPVFALKYRLPGVILMLPSTNDPLAPAEHKDQPQLMATFAQSARWARILGCSNVADLNEMVEKRRLREFIRVNEALQERSINEIAAKFVESGARLILVAGPSSSGKTTFAHRLMIALRVYGLRPLKLSMDDYYIDRDKIPLEADGQRDFEKLETLDVDLFNEHLVRLLQDEPVDAPRFNFKIGRREETTCRVASEPGQPIMVEGIHALNERLTRDIPRDRKFLIYVSALTTLNLDDHNRIRTTDLRLLRRMVRDHQFRGTAPEGTLAMWATVRRGEHRYIFPYQERADAMFNSTLVYEAAILKKYAYPMLIAVTPESPYYTLVRRLVKFLNYIQTADVEDEIPNNSILREFIGGCCFYREDD